MVEPVQDAVPQTERRQEPGALPVRHVAGKRQLLERARAVLPPQYLERALMAEIKRMQDAPVSAAELEKAKNQIITNQLRERETNNGKALALGDAAVLLGDPNRANTDIERLSKVTAADVQRVMRKYLTDTNRLVIYYLPESLRPAAPAPEKTGQTVEPKRRVETGGGK